MANSLFLSGRLHGFPLYVTEHAVNRPWLFPKDRFVEYTKEDEWWARKYSFGREGPPEPAAYRVGDDWLVHPVIYEQLKKETEKEKLRRDALKEDFYNNDRI